MVQPGVSALGKKNSTTVLPRKSFNATLFPFSSGKLNSGALSLVSMGIFASHSSLYRTSRRIVIWTAVLLLGLASVHAQYGHRPQVSKGPRATGLLELAANGKAHLIPIAIIINGKFYDAAAYKASPVPMALYSGTVYEAFRTGVSQGLFTAGGARQLENSWIAEGTWQAAGTAPAKTAHQAESAPVMEKDEGPPVLRHPSPPKPPADSNSTETKPSGTQSQSSPQAPTTPSASDTKTNTPPPAAGNAPQKSAAPNKDLAQDQAQAQDQKAGQDDKDHPVLRRGIPPGSTMSGSAMSKTAQSTVPEPPLTSKASSAARPSPKDSTQTGPVQRLPAISDADGPDPRPYSYDASPQQQQDFRKRMLAVAAVEVRNRAAALGVINSEPGMSVAASQRKSGTAQKAQPKFDDIQFRVFDLANSNEPILVLTAKAVIEKAASAKAPSGARLPPHPIEATASDLQYFVTLAGRYDINGELHKLFSNVTDTRHLDAIPRMELIDAVDADGDGRGELLFRKTYESGSAFVIYRATADQLWPLFEGTPGQ